jgi:hypothetical protein
VGLPPALLPAPDRSHVTVRSGRLQGGLDNNAARNPPACLTDRSPARRGRGVEYRNVAGTLEDEHAAQRAWGQVGAGGRPVGRSQRGVGRWHRGRRRPNRRAGSAARRAAAIASGRRHQIWAQPLQDQKPVRDRDQGHVMVQPRSRGPRSGPGRARPSIPGSPARFSTATWPGGPARPAA